MPPQPGNPTSPSRQGAQPRNSLPNPLPGAYYNTLDPKVVQANAYDNYSNRPAYQDPYAAWKVGGATPTPESTPGSVGGMAQYSADNPLSAIAHLSGVSNRGGSLPPSGPSAPGYTPLTADLTKNPYGPAYDQLLQFVKDSTAARGGQFDAAKAQFQAQQDAANKQLYDAYQGSRQGADQSAQALHVDPAVISATRDLMMRKNQENSDQRLADNLAWLDKSRILEGSMLNTTANTIAGDKVRNMTSWDNAEQNRVAAQNLAALKAMTASAVSKSKKGKGSGSSSSGGVNSTATETQTLQDGGLDKAFYDQLVNSGNKEAAALYLNQHVLNQGTPELKATQAKINALAQTNQVNGKAVPPANIYMPQSNLMNNWQTPAYTAAQKAGSQKSLYEQLLPGMMTNSGIMGNPKTVQTVKKTAKGKS